MGIYRKILDQRVLGNLLYVLVIVAGLAALRRMPVEEYPNVAFDQVSITTVWPGASPDDVERLVTKKIEDEIEDVRGIEFIRSTSIASASLISVKFEETLPSFERAYRDLESELGKVRELPEGCEKPEIERVEVE